MPYIRLIYKLRFFGCISLKREKKNCMVMTMAIYGVHIRVQGSQRGAGRIADGLA